MRPYGFADKRTAEKKCMNRSTSSSSYRCRSCASDSPCESSATEGVFVLPPLFELLEDSGISSMALADESR
jgi:hypothetical protein